MCGIVGAVARRDVPGILIEGLRRLEYRGYDSAGLAVIPHGSGRIERRRRVGKVKELSDSLNSEPLLGTIGIAHTRWATHGAPVERNASSSPLGGFSPFANFTLKASCMRRHFGMPGERTQTLYSQTNAHRYTPVLMGAGNILRSP